MSNFFVRTLTGAVFVIVVIGSAIWNFWAFAAVFGVFTVAGTWEFYKLISKTNVRPLKVIGTHISFAVYTVTVLAVSGMIEDNIALYYFSLLAISVLIFFIELFMKDDKPFHNIAAGYMGVLYLAIPFSLLLALSAIGNDSFGPFTFPALYFFMIWANDTFAYLVGNAIGKHKLFERISPKKTWEGAIGGLIFTIVLGCILSHYYTLFSMAEWIGLAWVIVIAGNFGDLAESMLKRSIGAKDSGSFFPGHGGILDRFDSLLLSVPFVFIYVELILTF